jgi:hypothetical protein
VDLYAANLSAEFKQLVVLERAPASRLFAPTWSIDDLISSPSDGLRGFLRELVQGDVDVFLNAFRSKTQRPGVNCSLTPDVPSVGI